LAAQGALGMIGGVGASGIGGLLLDGGENNYHAGHRQSLLSRSMNFAAGAVVSPWETGMAVIGGHLRGGDAGVVRITGWEEPDAANPRRGDPADYVSVFPASGFVADGAINYYSTAYVRA